MKVVCVHPSRKARCHFIEERSFLPLVPVAGESKHRVAIFMVADWLRANADPGEPLGNSRSFGLNAGPADPDDRFEVVTSDLPHAAVATKLSSSGVGVAVVVPLVDECADTGPPSLLLCKGRITCSAEFCCQSWRFLCLRHHV